MQITLDRSKLMHSFLVINVDVSSGVARGVPNMAEVGNCPICLAENGNVVHISMDSDTKIVNETEISFSEGRKSEIVIIIVADIGNHRS